ncbi:DNA cytosine methyltransferase [Facklamia hominis]
MNLEYIIEKIKIINYLVEEINKNKLLKVDKEYDFENQELKKLLSDLGIVTNKITLNDIKEKLLTREIKSLKENLNLILNNKDDFNDSLDKFFVNKKVDKEKPTIVDLFCGAGGMSYGFTKSGFRISLANDIEKVSINSYMINHPEISPEKIILGDIDCIKDSIKEIVNEKVDVVIGGPPCQGFSSANQQRIIDDPRNRLYKSFIDVVGILKPKFVVMENVKGMLKVADQVIEDFHNLNNTHNIDYKVSYMILNSHDFGVAQARERLIYLGVREDLLNLVTPENLFENINKQNHSKYILKDALEYIRPLKAETVQNRTNVYNEITGKLVDFNDYNPTKGSYINLINNNERKELIYNHKARYANPTNLEIYRRLHQGDDSTDEKIADIMPYAHRNHLFKDKYFKLIEDRPSRTITAHLRMDGHSHIHPNQARTLTPREAARIQSFPDDYIFMGAYLKTFMQIGNAVPPLMAKAIADEIIKYCR